MKILAVLFFASGFSALIYQVLWTRLVSAMIGGSDYSIAIIVTIFMAGLGIGSKIAGVLSRRLNRTRDALLAFAVIEALTAFYAMALPYIAPLARPWLAWFYNASLDQPHLYHLGALIVCVVVIIPPVLLMGATLPILCSAIANTLSSSRVGVPFLYGVNTLGAAAGALAAGFYLIYALGVRATNFLAAGIDLTVALACFVLAYRIGKTPHESPRVRDAAPDDTPPIEPYQRHYGWAALIITFVSGFTALSAEVIWTKLFGLLAGPTTFSFSVVLFCYILCLGVGSLIAIFFTRNFRDVMPVLIVLQVIISLAIVAASHFIGNGSLFFAKITYQFQAQPGLLEVVKLLAILLLIGVPVTLIGVSFPLAFRVYSIARRGIGESIGNLYAINTIGSVLGSGLTGFFLIPFLGMESSLSGIALFQLVVIVLLAVILFQLRGLAKLLIIAGAAISILITLQYPTWNKTHLAEGKYHRFQEQGLSLDDISYGRALWRGAEILNERVGDIELLYYGEGIGGFTTVMEETDVLGNRRVYMANSGKVDASSHGDIYTQALLAHLPALVKPGATNALSIGFGCGMTSGEFLHYPGLQVDSVEISPQVIAAARYFDEWNNRVLDSSRNRTIVQDARAHLALGNIDYDIITAEPSNPWMAGLANLFTIEYLNLVKSRLSERGVFVQFLHSYQMDWETFSLMTRTINTVFPNAILFRPAFFGSDYALLCFKHPDDGLKYETLASMISYARRSEVITIAEPEVIYPLIVTEDVAGLVGPGPVHTDNDPLLELLAPRSMYRDGADVNALIESRRVLSPATRAVMDRFVESKYQLAFARYLASGNQPPFLVMDAAATAPEDWEAFLAAIDYFARQNPVFDYMAVPEDLRGWVAGVQEPLMLQQRSRLLLADHPDKKQLSAVHASLVSLYRSTGRMAELSHALLHLIMLNPDDWTIKASLASLYYQQGAYASALELLRGDEVLAVWELVLLRAQCMVMMGAGEVADDLIRRAHGRLQNPQLITAYAAFREQVQTAPGAGR